ncbi:sulfonate/nitrate/taurine transport system permease [Brucella sp. NVSL 07-0026]|nr:sulfonate/nitrate/taurine transport system permease [Brucella sp. NVSL 07-0026]
MCAGWGAAGAASGASFLLIVRCVRHGASAILPVQCFFDLAAYCVKNLKRRLERLPIDIFQHFLPNRPRYFPKLTDLRLRFLRQFDALCAPIPLNGGANDHSLFFIGLFSYVRAGLVPLVAALFPIPKIALLPLFVIWFGIDEMSKYMLIAFGTFTPTVVATYGAVDNVDRSLIRMGQSFGLSWWSIVRKIVLPGAFPAILSGLRVSISIAIILLVAAEMLGAQYGVGSYILEAGSLYDLEKLFAGVAILSVMGLIVNVVIGWVERRFLNWRG